jgi:hypothetical protein
MSADDAKAETGPSLRLDVSCPCIPTQPSEIYSDHLRDRDDGPVVLYVCLRF